MPLIQCDAAQLEWRVLVELARDEVALQEILGKEDTHTKNQGAFSLPSRLIAKIYLFRTIYRGSGWSFANDPQFTHVSSDPKFWDDINVKFFTKYSGIDKCHQEWAESVKQGNTIIGPLGRQWFIELDRDRFGNLRIPWTKLTNYPVQGTGADVMQVARISFWNRLQKQPWADKVKLRSTVHDSIVVDAPKELIQEIVNIFHQVFDDLPKNFKKLYGYDWVVPLDCECKVGPNMRDMEKVKRTDIA